VQTASPQTLIIPVNKVNKGNKANRNKRLAGAYLFIRYINPGE
jgi:hypothetical protein